MVFALIENEHFNLALIFKEQEPGGLIIESPGKDNLSSNMKIEKFEKGTKDELMEALKYKEKQLIDDLSSRLNTKVTRTAMRVISDADLNRCI